MDSESSETITRAPRKFSLSNWPMFRVTSPWDTVNIDTEFLYNEELLRYADRLEEDKIERQMILNQNMPRSGSYTASIAKYLKTCHKPQDDNGLYAVRFNQDGSYIIAAYESGRVEAINMDKELVITIKHGVKASQGPSSIKFHPSQKDLFYFSCASGKIFTGRLIKDPSADVDSWEIKKVAKEGNNQIYAMDINLSGDMMLTGGKDSKIRVYDLETNDIIGCYSGFAMECKDSYDRLLDEGEEEGHYLNIYSIVCHTDNPFVFASAGIDSNIKLWDLRIKKYPVKSIFGPHIMGDSIDLMGDKVLSGQWSSDDGLQLWDSGSCRLLKTFRPSNAFPQSFGQYFYCAKFMKDLDGSASGDIIVAGGTGMGGLTVASLKEDLILACFQDEGSILTVDNKMDLLVYGGTSHILYLSQFATMWDSSKNSVNSSPVSVTLASRSGGNHEFES